MSGRFRNFDHVLRVAALFAFGFLVFLIVRRALVPADFGVYGFYRAGALEDARARPIAYGGQRSCVSCHEKVVKEEESTKHAKVLCESCHGPLASHAADERIKVARIDSKKSCLACHEQRAGRYEGFPQIVLADHGEEGTCTDSQCHRPHKPKGDEGEQERP